MSPTEEDEVVFPRKEDYGYSEPPPAFSVVQGAHPTKRLRHLWSYQKRGDTTEPILDRNRGQVYFATDKKRGETTPEEVICIGPNGEAKWKCRLPAGGSHVGCTDKSELVLVGTREAREGALKGKHLLVAIRKGEPLWEKPLEGWATELVPRDDESAILSEVLTENDYYVSLHDGTGEVLKRIRMSRKNHLLRWNHDLDIFVVMDYHNRLRAFDRNGEKIGSFRAKWLLNGLAPSLDGRHVFTGSGGGKFEKRDISTGDLTDQWTVPGWEGAVWIASGHQESKDEILLSPAIDSAECVSFVLRRPQHLALFSLKEGRVLWQREVWHGIAAFADGDVYHVAKGKVGEEGSIRVWDHAGVDIGQFVPPLGSSAWSFATKGDFVAVKTLSPDSRIHGLLIEEK